MNMSTNSLNYFLIIYLIGHSYVTSLLTENSHESVYINWPFNREFTFSINIDKMIMKYFSLIFFILHPAQWKALGVSGLI